MRSVFSPEAKAEFDAAVRYYERQMPTLGKKFAEDVRQGLKRLARWPLAAPIERDDIRRLVLGRFPYKLLYSVETDCIYLLAVAHQHRAPSYWQDRTPA